MNKSLDVSYLDSNKQKAQTPAEQASLSKICNEVVRDMREMLQSMFDGIDDSFFELANNARTNNEQNRFFEAMREIRIKRRGIESSFSRELSNNFSHDKVLKSKTEKSETKYSSIESLSLIQNEDLEQEVAISSMASKARSNFQGPLLTFHTRIANLYGAGELSQISAPLDPKDICETFSRACTDLEIGIKELLIIYKQFDRYVMSNLEHVYENANKTLIRLGVMPKLKTPGVRKKAVPRGESASSPITQNEEPISQPGLHENNTSKNVFLHLQSLLANIKTPEQKQSTDSGAFIIQTDDIVSMLTDIQKAPSMARGAKATHASVIDIRSALRKELGANAKQADKKQNLSQIDEDLINLVSMLFEFILEDYNLAPPIQVLISRLQIPILKVVMHDKSFFGSNKHPARKLLNSLAKAGLGWNEGKDLSNDALYQQIHHTVHKILDEFDGNVSLFTTLNEEFQLFINKANQKAKLIEQRTKEVEVGRIKSKQAQAKVESVLSNRILDARHPISATVSNTLKNGWSRVMFLAFLKDDEEHQWTHSVKIAEDLIWCLQPLAEPKDRQKWITVVPKLLKDLKNGLSEVSYKSAELDSTLAEIKSELTTSFKNSSFDGQNKGSIHKTKKEAKSLVSAKTAVQKQVESKDDVLEKYLDMVDKLTVGTWVEFLMLNGNKFRCKLSTMIPEADSYIFVNRMGLKTVEKTREELAEDLRKKQFVVLEQGLIIDRAMDALTSSLRQKANA